MKKKRENKQGGEKMEKIKMDSEVNKKEKGRDKKT